MSNALWYCVINGKQEGPYTVEILQGMAVTTPFASDMPVWSEGMATWKPLPETALAGLVKTSTTPPPVPLGSVLQAGTQNVASQLAGATASMSAAINAPIGSTTAPGFVDAIKICLSKYADFNGRASRPEFWWFYLFTSIVLLVSLLAPFLMIIAFLALIVPSIAVTVRRLHDTDRSGWWYLVIFVPFVGSIALLVFLVLQGTQGQNRFG
jgi:uncharacterized membrane protein YhaH (DUF805 family)